MLFNSFEFLVFFSILVVLYFSIAQRFRWMLLLGASYYFYMSWKPEYVLLILFTSLVSYYCGIWMHNAKTLKRRKHFLWLSLAINLGVLFFFKYFNFVNDGVREVLQSFSLHYSFEGLDILLPIGISFYTFQTVGYNLDVFYQVRKPEKHFGIFALFVSFFPQLIAGPIERSTVLLPQFKKKHHFNLERIQHGLKYIIWGLFKKLVIADRLVPIIGEAYGNLGDYSGSTLWFATFLYAIQLYADFSAYSEIAKGLAKILGYDLMENFDHPFKSKNITEFWRRWHISLSTWFRDYLYIPLGGSRGTNYFKIRNVFIIFLVSGFWHGSNWTFIVWGGLNALYFLPIMLLNKNKINTDVVAQGKYLPSVREVLSMTITFSLTTIAWIFFRAENIHHAISYLSNIIHPSILTFPELITPKLEMIYTLLCIFILLLFEWMNREKIHALDIANYNKSNRWMLYLIIIIMIITFGAFNHNSFIYFQF